MTSWTARSTNLRTLIFSKFGKTAKDIAIANDSAAERFIFFLLFELYPPSAPFETHNKPTPHKAPPVRHLRRQHPIFAVSRTVDSSSSASVLSLSLFLSRSLLYSLELERNSSCWRDSRKTHSASTKLNSGTLTNRTTAVISHSLAARSAADSQTKDEL